MKKIFLAIALTWASVAQANIIEISTDEVAVTAGEEVNFVIDLVNFEEFDFLSFSLGFDDTLLSFDETSLTSDFAFADLVNGSFAGLDVFADAGILFFSLTADFLVGETFMGAANLVTFNFLATGTGVANFTPVFESFDSVSLSQNELDAPNFRVAADVNPVSEPSALGLFAVFLLGGGVLRRRLVASK